jgi:hypothetical protein
MSCALVIDQVERKHTADKNPPDHLQSSFSMVSKRLNMDAEAHANHFFIS